MTRADDQIPTIFDADNHYWEASDTFTRYRNPKYADRGVLVKEIDGRMRYVVHDELHPWVPGPGDVNPRPRPGALFDYFTGKGAKTDVARMLTCEEPSEHPEWFNRDARIEVMDEQGVEAAWLFPSQGVCMEGSMQPDMEAAVDIFHGFNRWLDDEWGFAYQDRIFAVPYLTLSDLDSALAELEWVIGRGRRWWHSGRVRCSPPTACSPRPTRSSIPSGRGWPRRGWSWPPMPDSTTATGTSRTPSPEPGATRAGDARGRCRRCPSTSRSSTQ